MSDLTRKSSLRCIDASRIRDPFVKRYDVNDEDAGVGDGSDRQIFQSALPCSFIKKDVVLPAHCRFVTPTFFRM